jgi:hypothetical protein
MSQHAPQIIVVCGETWTANVHLPVATRVQVLPRLVQIHIIARFYFALNLTRAIP